VSPRLPRISGDEAAQTLERAGFHRISQRGSHLKLRSDDGRVVIIPPTPLPAGLRDRASVSVIVSPRRHVDNPIESMIYIKSKHRAHVKRWRDGRWPAAGGQPG